MTDDDDAKVIMTFRVDCLDVDPDPGSEIRACAKCGADVWLSISGMRTLELGIVDRVECCHCLDMHNPLKIIERALRQEDGMHFHSFSGGLCECSMTETEWLALPEGARQIHDQMKRVYEALKEK